VGEGKGPLRAKGGYLLLKEEEGSQAIWRKKSVEVYALKKRNWPSRKISHKWEEKEIRCNMNFTRWKKSGLKGEMDCNLGKPHQRRGFHPLKG